MHSSDPVTTTTTKGQDVSWPFNSPFTLLCVMTFSGETEQVEETSELQLFPVSPEQGNINL